MGFSIDVDGEAHGSRRTLRLRGELDVAGAGALTGAVERALADGAAGIVLDMSELSFLDSAGLRTVLLCRRSCDERNAELVIATPSRAARRLFEIAGLAEILETGDDAGVALDAPGGDGAEVS